MNPESIEWRRDDPLHLSWGGFSGEDLTVSAVPRAVGWILHCQQKYKINSKPVFKIFSVCTKRVWCEERGEFSQTSFTEQFNGCSTWLLLKYQWWIGKTLFEGCEFVFCFFQSTSCYKWWDSSTGFSVTKNRTAFLRFYAFFLSAQQ